MHVDPPAGGDTDDGVRIRLRDGLDQLILSKGQLKGAVEALALCGGIEANGNNGGVGKGGDLCCLGTDELVDSTNAVLIVSP